MRTKIFFLVVILLFLAVPVSSDPLPEYSVDQWNNSDVFMSDSMIWNSTIGDYDPPIYIQRYFNETLGFLEIPGVADQYRGGWINLTVSEPIQVDFVIKSLYNDTVFLGEEVNKPGYSTTGILYASSNRSWVSNLEFYFDLADWPVSAWYRMSFRGDYLDQDRGYSMSIKEDRVFYLNSSIIEEQEPDRVPYVYDPPTRNRWLNETTYLTAADEGETSNQSITTFAQTTPIDALFLPDYWNTAVHPSAVEDHEYGDVGDLIDVEGSNVVSREYTGTLPIWIPMSFYFPVPIDKDVINVTFIYRFQADDCLGLDFDVYDWDQDQYVDDSDPANGTVNTWINITITPTDSAYSEGNPLLIRFSIGFDDAPLPAMFVLAGAMQSIEIDYAVCNQEQESNHFLDDFVDVSDWVDVSTADLGTDGDVMYVDIAGDAAYDYFYTNELSFPADTLLYYEYRVARNASASHVYLSVVIYSEDDQGGTGTSLDPNWYVSSTDFVTRSGHITLSLATECLRMRARNGNPSKLYFDYFRIGPADELGFQHDGSTTEGLTEQYPGRGTISTDGDTVTYACNQDSARLIIWVDETSTTALVDADYYHFLEFSITSITDGDGDGQVWRFRGFEVDDSNDYSAFSSGWSDDTGVFRINLDAWVYDDAFGGGDMDDFKYFKFYMDDALDSITFDYITAYSIANITVASAGAAESTNMIYVDDGELCMIYGVDIGVWALSHDPDLDVDIESFNVINVTSSTGLGGLTEFRTSLTIDGETQYIGGTRDEMIGTTLTDMQLRIYAVGTYKISAIEFWKDSVDPVINAVYANPPDPYDDESLTFTVIVDESISIYNVIANAIDYPTGFSDVDYEFNQVVDDEAYEYTFNTLLDGDYLFLITADDGQDTDSEYYPITVRESEITLSPISYFGVGTDFTQMQLSFDINKDCSYTIFEESATYSYADTQTGSVSRGWSNIAWDKISVTDTSANFSIVFVNGSLSTFINGSYSVAQTTFYVEDRSITETPVSVTISGRITKEAAYAIYDISNDLKNSGSITDLDFKISFDKWIVSTEQEIFFAIKLTNGSQTCWINWTYYAIDPGEYGQVPGITNVPDWALGIGYWNVFSAIIIIFALFGIYIKFGNLPNVRSA